MVLLFPRALIAVGPAESRAARVNSSDIKNKFWRHIMVSVLLLLTTFTQEDENSANASGFGLHTNFYLCCKHSNPLTQECTSRTRGKQINKVNSIYAFFALNCCFLFTNCTILEFSLFYSILIHNRKQQPSTYALPVRSAFRRTPRF